MNDLQKKFAIVGSTAFIVWLLMAFANDSFNYDDSGPLSYNLKRFINYSIYGGLIGVTWIQTTTFITWLGSLIAFFAYKD